MSMKLHCFGESGNSLYKAALTLTLAGEVNGSLSIVDFFKGAHTLAGVSRRTEPSMAEVPVLEDGDTVLTQSGVIQDYVSSKTGKLGGKSAAERREVLRWMFFDNHCQASLAHCVST